jgi:heat shock protein HslJ
MRPLLTVILLAAPAWAGASTPQSLAALDRASAAACLAAADLVGARVGPPMRFSDRTRTDARVVTGRWRPAHLNGAEARMLCLYDRRTRRAEVQELATDAAPPPSAAVEVARDVFWRAVEIDGQAPLGRQPITVYFGSDGRIAGRSGCNNYSARYVLNGSALTVYPPLIGTRMACPSEVMAQEARFQDILSRVRTVQAGSGGTIVLTAVDGAAIRLAR